MTSSSFLSAKVSRLFNAACHSVKCASHLSDHRHAIVETADGLIVFDSSTALANLAKDQLLLPFDQWDHEHCVRLLEALAPLFCSGFNFLIERRDEMQLLATLKPYYLNQVVSECIVHLSIDDEDNSAEALLAILKLTVLIEGFLRDAVICCPDRQQTSLPFLLKDLVQLANSLHLWQDDPFLELILLLLMGTPKALNIRNVAWHGFLAPHEASPILATTMIILLMSLVHKLRPQVAEVITHRIGCRAKTNPLADHCLDWYKYCVSVCDKWKSVQLDELLFQRAKEEDRSKCGVVLREVIRLRSEGRDSDCLNLLVPEWECVCRNVWCASTNQPDRTLTADTDITYTTFDQMIRIQGMEPFAKLIGPHHLAFLRDALDLPAGPRLRDRLSHGQLISLQSSNDLARLLCIPVMASLIDLLDIPLMSSNSDSPKADLLQGYSSRYHPVTVMLRISRKLLDALLDIEDKMPPFRTVSLEHEALHSIDVLTDQDSFLAVSSGTCSKEVTSLTGQWTKIFEEAIVGIESMKAELAKLREATKVGGSKSTTAQNRIAKATCRLEALFPRLYRCFLRALIDSMDDMKLLCRAGAQEELELNQLIKRRRLLLRLSDNLAARAYETKNSSNKTEGFLEACGF